MNWMVYAGLGVLAVLTLASPVMFGWIALVAIAYAYFTWHKDRKPRE